MIIHPTLMKYAELVDPYTSLERRKEIAENAFYNLKASFEDPGAIDYVTWTIMASAIDHPDISEYDFSSVYEEGWDECSLLYEIVQEMLHPVDFSNKALEDYL